MNTRSPSYLLPCPPLAPEVPLCSAANPPHSPPHPGPLCLGTRWTADRGPNIPERLCFRASAALWDLLSWPPELDNSARRWCPSARLAAGPAQRSACMSRVGRAWTRSGRRAPPIVGIKLKRQVLPKLYARQAVGAYHSKALLIKCQSR